MEEATERPHGDYRSRAEENGGPKPVSSWSYSQEEYQEVGDACLYLPTSPAVLCPGQLGQRRGTRLGANNLGQIPALSLASCVSPTGQVTSLSLTISPWDAGDNRSLSTAVKFAGITYVKAHGRCSISIPSRSRSASPPGAGGIATHQPEVEEGRGRAVVPTPGRQKRLL